MIPETLVLGLVDQQLESISASDMAQYEVVGFYISNNVDKACQAFTVKLRQFFRTINMSSNRLGIVYVTKDEKKLWQNTMKARPFLGSPPEQYSKILESLQDVYSVDIDLPLPQLILINQASGELISKYGVDHITADSAGHNFPWTPSILKALQSISFYQPDKKPKYLGLFFGTAQTLSECLSLRRLVKAVGGPSALQIIVVTCEGKKYKANEWFESVRHPSWIMFPNKEDRVMMLFDLYMVNPTNIPQFTLLDANDLSLVHLQAMSQVIQNDDGRDFPWDPRYPSISELTSIAQDRIADEAWLTERNCKKPMVVVKGTDSRSRRGGSIFIDKQRFQGAKDAFRKLSSGMINISEPK